jgi:hypothetical protein
MTALLRLFFLCALAGGLVGGCRAAQLRSPKHAAEYGGPPIIIKIPPGKPYRVKLAWDAVPGAASYFVRYGRHPDTLTNSASSYVTSVTVSNLTFSPWFFQGYTIASNGMVSDGGRLARFPTTNMLYAMSARSNVYAALSLRGPWRATNNTLAFTNPTGQQFFRGYGCSNYIERW